MSGTPTAPTPGDASLGLSFDATDSTGKPVPEPLPITVYAHLDIAQPNPTPALRLGTYATSP